MKNKFDVCILHNGIEINVGVLEINGEERIYDGKSKGSLHLVGKDGDINIDWYMLKFEYTDNGHFHALFQTIDNDSDIHDYYTTFNVGDNDYLVIEPSRHAVAKWKTNSAIYN